MTAQAGLLWSAGAAAALAALATLFEWRRGRRPNLDRVGWMPWQTIAVLGFFAAVGLAGVALNL